MSVKDSYGGLRPSHKTWKWFAWYMDQGKGILDRGIVWIKHWR